MTCFCLLFVYMSAEVTGCVLPCGWVWSHTVWVDRSESQLLSGHVHHTSHLPQLICHSWPSIKWPTRLIDQRYIWSLNGVVHPKMKIQSLFIHSLCCSKSVRPFLSKSQLDHIAYHCREENRISSIVVWNDMRVSNFHFWVNYPFNSKAQHTNKHKCTPSIAHPAHVRTILFYKASIIVTSP